MSSKLLQLSLYVVTVIQLTSSQSTYDDIQQQSDVNSCGHPGHLLSELMTAVLQLQTAMSQLQRDVAEMKAATVRKDGTGKLKHKKGEKSARIRLKG